MNDFQVNKYQIVRNAVSGQKLTDLVKYYERHKDNGSLFSLERNNGKSVGTYGDVKGEQLLLDLLPEIENVVGEELYPTYSYTRCYFGGSKLKKHVDRYSNEYTVTVSLCKDESSIDWPLELNDPFGNHQKVNLSDGDMLIFKGQDLLHWREAYQGKYWIQIFLSYVGKQGEYKHNKLDKRTILGTPNIRPSNIYVSAFASDYLNKLQVDCTRVAVKKMLENSSLSMEDIDLYLRCVDHDNVVPVKLKSILENLGCEVDIKLIPKKNIHGLDLPIIVHVPNQKVYMLIVKVTESYVTCVDHVGSFVDMPLESFYNFWNGIVISISQKIRKVDINKLIKLSKHNLLNYTDSIKVLEQFLTIEECNQIIKSNDNNKVLTGSKDFPIKYSNQFFLEANLNLTQQLRGMLAKAFSVEEIQIELLEYNELISGFSQDPTYEYENKTRNPLKRIKSGIIILNKPQKGGNIHFPEVEYQVKLNSGDLLCYDLLTNDKRQEFKSLIEIKPVIEGSLKFIKFWIREK